MNMHCCYDCKKRWVDVKTGQNCHNDCEVYKKEVERNEAIKEKERRSRNKSWVTNGKKKNYQKTRKW